MEESKNSSQPIIVNDMDVILSSEFEEYKRKNEFANTTVVDFDSLFNENGDFEGAREMRNELEDEIFVEDDEEVRFGFSNLDTPPVSSPSSPSDFSSSSSEIDGVCRGHGSGVRGGGNEDVEKPSFLQMALLDEEKIGACTSYVKDSKPATLLPRSFPTRPRNCIHHIIPFSLFTQELAKRFPFNLNAKRKLMAKYGYPDPNSNSNYFMSPDGPHYLSAVNVNVEDIPSINPDEKKVVTVLKQRKSNVKDGKGETKTTATVIIKMKKTRQVSPKIKCQFCDKTYKQKGAMKRHAREKHGVDI